LSAITSLLLIFASLISMQDDLVFLAASLLGITVGLLFYNLPPARLFMGDSGVQSLGFFLGAISILYNPVVQPQEASWFVPITLLAVPIFDVGLVIFSRLKDRTPLFTADLKHTYHRLTANGLSHLKALWSMDMAALFSGSIGLYALYQEPLTANLIFLGLLIVGGFLVIRLAK
jgi:UDP-GlcNAc:undecaprenyl-phosphate GlcNAc-1-phosphate transferase